MNLPHNISDLMRGKDAARLLNVGRLVVYRLMASGELPAVGQLAAHRIKDVPRTAPASGPCGPC
jgi:excisionase family DNA binding protein